MRLRLVAGCEHDTPADDDGPAAQTRIVSLLDRREERVEVGVQNRRFARHEHMFAWPSRVCLFPLGGGGVDEFVGADSVPAPSDQRLPYVPDENVTQVFVLEKTAHGLGYEDLSTFSGVA